jgi:hypothetical protein
VAKVEWHLDSSSVGVNVESAVFGTTVSFIAMVHAIQGSQCVWASASPMTTVRSSTSLDALGRSLVESSKVCVVRGCSVAFVPVI